MTLKISNNSITVDRPALKKFFILAGLATTVGILVGIGAILFRYLLAFTNNIFLEGRIGFDYDPFAPFLTSLGWIAVFTPAIGGLIAGLLIYKFAQEAKGHSVPEVMEAMSTNEGKIRPRVALVKALASAFTIGSGGSAGREGPMVQIGAASGSGLAQTLGLSGEETRILLACGAAGGIAATFNTPIGGVLFALELILLERSTKSFVPLVISTMMATFIARAFLGNFISLPVQNLYTLTSTYEIPLYILLGIICGIAAVFFIKMLYGIEGWAERWNMRSYLKPVVGGAAVGLIGLSLYLVFGHYYIYGVSYGLVLPVLRSEVVTNTVLQLFLLLVLLAFVKMLATSLTLGSGGSGGVLSPMLIFGALVGGAFGILMNWIFPTVTAPFGAYAIVGMAALFAGASRATLTAIVIMFEMTMSYSIILPLMLACVVSAAVGYILSKETIDTMKLKLKGVKYSSDHEVNPMEMHAIKEVMAKDVVTVKENTTVKDVSDLSARTGYQGFPVLDEGGRLCGIVTMRDIRCACEGGNAEKTLKDASAIKPAVTVQPEQSLAEALEIMSVKGYGRILVVDEDDNAKVIGIVTRSRILDIYKKKVKAKEGGWT